MVPRASFFSRSRELKLADLLGAHQLRRLVKVFGELFNGQDVAANGIGVVVAALEVLQHSFS
jgi:hypothetical protein